MRALPVTSGGGCLPARLRLPRAGTSFVLPAQLQKHGLIKHASFANGKQPTHRASLIILFVYSCKSTVGKPVTGLPPTCL